MTNTHLTLEKCEKVLPSARPRSRAPLSGCAGIASYFVMRAAASDKRVEYGKRRHSPPDFEISTQRARVCLRAPGAYL